MTVSLFSLIQLNKLFCKTAILSKIITYYFCDSAWCVCFHGTIFDLTCIIHKADLCVNKQWPLTGRNLKRFRINIGLLHGYCISQHISGCSNINALHCNSIRLWLFLQNTSYSTYLACICHIYKQKHKSHTFPSFRPVTHTFFVHYAAGHSVQAVWLWMCCGNNAWLTFAQDDF